MVKDTLSIGLKKKAPQSVLEAYNSSMFKGFSRDLDGHKWKVVGLSTLGGDQNLGLFAVCRGSNYPAIQDL